LAVDVSKLAPYRISHFLGIALPEAAWPAVVSR